MVIKLIIFDLDGTLVETRELHQRALNHALVKHQQSPIPEDELYKYEALSTREKLDAYLVHESEEMKQMIWKEKQLETRHLLEHSLDFNPSIFQCIRMLKVDGYKLALASNCIRSSVLWMLNKLSIDSYFDVIVSSDDVKYNKPHTDMYQRCMDVCHTTLDETLILEDSELGRRAIQQFGSYGMFIHHPSDVSYSNIKTYIRMIELKTRRVIVIPMAGEGSRFHSFSSRPKPGIDVCIHGRRQPMVAHVVDNLLYDKEHVFFVFILRKKAHEEFIPPGIHYTTFITHEKTRGALETVMYARPLLNSPHWGIMIANSDQWIEWNPSLDQLLSGFDQAKNEGGILTFPSSDPKFSYALTDPQGNVLQVAEKTVISNHASVGIYLFKHGDLFVSLASQMIERNELTRGEFYVCPLYNKYIEQGYPVYAFPCGEMFCLGTPEDLFDSEYRLNLASLSGPMSH